MALGLATLMWGGANGLMCMDQCKMAWLLLGCAVKLYWYYWQLPLWHHVLAPSYVGVGTGV